MAGRKKKTRGSVVSDSLYDNPEFFDSIMKNSFEGIFVLDQDIKYAFLNPACGEIFNQDPEKKIGTVAGAYTHPDDVELGAEAIREAFNGKRSACKIRVMGKDKKYRFLDMKFSPMLWNKEPHIVGFVTDITEQEKQKGALESTEQMFKFISENTSDMIALCNVDFDMLYASPSHKQLGYEPEELIGKDGSENIHPDDIEAMLPLLQEAMKKKGDSTKEVVYREKNKDGDWRFIASTINFIPESGDQEARLVTVSRDITEHMAADEELRLSESKYRSFVENSAFGLFQLDLDGNMLYGNEMGYKIAEFPEDIEPGFPFTDLLHPDDLDRAFEDFGMVAMGEPNDGPRQYRIITYKGNERHVEVNTIAIIDNGEIVGFQGTVNDITDKVKAQEALKASEERYKRIAESISDNIWITDLDMNYTYVSPKVEKIFGYTPKEAIELKMEDTVPAEYLEMALEAFQEEFMLEMDPHSDPNRTRTMEMPQKHKKGHFVWTEVSVTFLRDDDGKPIGILGVTRDISQRKEAEEAIRKSEARYRGLFETIPIGLYETTPKGEIIAANQALVEMLGYETLLDLKRTNVGKDLYADPKDRRNLTKELEKKGVLQSVEFDLRKKDGDTITVLENARVIKDAKGKVKYYEGVLRDITEWKQKELKIRESESKYSALVENTSDGVVILQDGLVKYANKGGAALVGLKVDELVGTDFTKFLAKDFQKLVKQRYINRLKGDSVPGRYDINLKDKKGRSIPAEISASVVEYQGKLAIQANIRDITERKRMEEELTHHKENLEELVRKRTEELTKANDKLKMEITERKKAEEALRISEEKYRTLFENLSTGVYRTTPGRVGEFIEVNPALVKILGYRSRKELIKKPVLETYVDPKERSKFSKKILKDGFVKNEEMHLLKKDGSQIIASITSTLVRDEKGKPLYFDGILEDITEQKRVEEALRESEERMRAILSSMEDTILMVFDDESTFLDLWISPVLEKKTGLKGGTMNGQRLIDIDPTPEARFRYDQIKRIFKTGENIRDEYVLRTPHGEFWQDISLSPLKGPEGNVQAVVAVSRDITERVLAERALQENERRLNDFVQNAVVGIYRTTPDGRVLMANPAMLEILGYETLEGLKKKDLEGKEYAPEYDRQMFKQKIEEEGEVIGYESVWTRKNGQKVHVRENSRAFRDLDDNILYYEGTVENITNHKRLEEEIQKMNKLESLGILAGGIAHDFNNILTSIMGNISLARSYVVDNQRLINKLDQAENSAMRASDLTHKLITFSKGGKPIKETVSIEPLMMDSINFVLRDSKLDVDFNIAEELLQVEIDKGQINQVFNNLAINATQAMPKGGKLTIKAENVHLTKKDSLPLEKGDYIRIEISDNGPGIRKEDIPKLFDPFFTTKQDGTGLGLATCYSILKSHNGYITVESKKGKGASFQIYLPAVIKCGIRKNEKDPGQPTILVMDDEVTIREILCEMLVDAGYNVESAVDGKEAIDIYRKSMKKGRKVDIVLLDLHVSSGMSGQEAIKKLLKIDPNVKAIVSSGYSEDAIMAEYGDHGFSGVVSKPYKFSVLSKEIERLLTE